MVLPPDEEAEVREGLAGLYYPSLYPPSTLTRPLTLRILF